MSGHSKWSTIKHAKGAADAKRGKIFSKHSKYITLAAKAGGDPDLNPALRQSIASAKADNMPNDNIERAIKKGTGDLEGVSYEDGLYEGYGPGGVAFLVEVVTDNKNRSASEIRHLFSKNNGSFADSGSVAYLFERKGEILLSAEGRDADQVLDLALEAGAEDLESSETEHLILTPGDQLSAVATRLREKEIELIGEKLIYKPGITIPIEDPATARSALRLFDLLEDWDDQVGVYSNLEISDALIEQLAADEE